MPCEPPLDGAVVLYGVRRFLLVLHALGSVALLGSATHHALHMRHYLAGRFVGLSLEKRWARVVAASYCFTFAVGAMLYPSYRYHVRGLWLDRYAPRYAELFDIKEIYASLTLVVAVGLGLLSFTLEPAKERAIAKVYAAMSLLVCAVAWAEVVLGVLVTSVRGLG
jgi:hypothetical protein